MPSISEMATNVFILDIGSYTLKAGFATDSEARVIPNCITKAKSERRRSFIGNQLEECKDFSGLFYMYPTQKGAVIDFELQKQIFDYIFSPDFYNVDFKETCCIYTEPYFNLSSSHETMIELMLEEYKFHSILGVHPATLSAYKSLKTHPSDLCSLVVDTGFTFTHLVPSIKGKILKNNIKKIEIGGKILTNHLKEQISYRHLNVMDETYVTNQIKEDIGFVSQNLEKDLYIARLKGKENTLRRYYVLPDYTIIKRGFVRLPEENEKPTEQTIKIENEQFMVPEVLFRPSIISQNQMGISEAIVHCIESTPEEIQPHLYRNIVLTGGNAKFPGFRDRILNDIRPEVPDIYDVKVNSVDNPITNAWEGGMLLSNDPEFAKLIVTRKQYEENGINYIKEKFDTTN